MVPALLDTENDKLKTILTVPGILTFWKVLWCTGSQEKKYKPFYYHCLLDHPPLIFLLKVGQVSCEIFFVIFPINTTSRSKGPLPTATRHRLLLFVLMTGSKRKQKKKRERKFKWLMPTLMDTSDSDWLSQSRNRTKTMQQCHMQFISPACK